jgi:hypothetical protein
MQRPWNHLGLSSFYEKLRDSVACTSTLVKSELVPQLSDGASSSLASHGDSLRHHLLSLLAEVPAAWKIDGQESETQKRAWAAQSC